MEKVFDETFAGGKNKGKKIQADRTGQDWTGRRCRLQFATESADGWLDPSSARLGPVLSSSASAQPGITFGQRTRKGGGIPAGFVFSVSLSQQEKRKKKRKKKKEKKENFSLSLSVTLIRIVFIFQSSLPCQFLKAILSVFHSHEEAGLDVRVR